MACPRHGRSMPRAHVRCLRCGTLTTTALHHQTIHNLFSGPLRPLAGNEWPADVLGAFLKRVGWLRRRGALPSKEPFRLQLPPGSPGLWQAARSWRLAVSVGDACRSLRLARMRANLFIPPTATAQPCPREFCWTPTRPPPLNLERQIRAPISVPSAAALRALECVL